jgi:hypothetical protein
MFEKQPEEHKMILDKIDSTGIEEWYCPTCGRRFLLQWPPEYKKVILDPGDENVSHNGGKSGLRLGISQVVHQDDPKEDDPALTPWIEWMKHVNFECLWDK